jgi:WD40 repeat protein
MSLSADPVGPPIVHEATLQGWLDGAWSADGKLLLVAGRDGVLELLDGQSMLPIAPRLTLFTNGLASVSFSPRAAFASGTQPLR